MWQVIAVVDRGYGIPANQMDQLFTAACACFPGHQPDRPGVRSGPGDRQDHRRSPWRRRRGRKHPGAGSTFRIRLPRAAIRHLDFRTDIAAPAIAPNGGQRGRQPECRKQPAASTSSRTARMTRNRRRRQRAMLVRTLRPSRDIRMFATMAGEVNPAHVDPEYARSAQFRRNRGARHVGGAMIANLLGTQFPGPARSCSNQNLRFAGEVRIGDTVTTPPSPAGASPIDGRVVFDCVCVNQDGTRVVDSEAEVAAPTERFADREHPRRWRWKRHGARATSICCRSRAAWRRSP